MKYLTTKDVCDILHMNREKAYKLFKVKGFPCVKIGRDYLIDEEAFQKFMKSHENTTIYIE